MSGLDDSIAGLGSSGSVPVVVAVALLLGLRHATDPDHLAAVSTLIASERDDGMRRAGRLGLAWGAGHATTLFALGLPVVLFRSYLPEGVQRAAEVAAGIMIAALAIRLLARWRQGRFHVHAHRHGAVEHRHLHAHPAAEHDHSHEAVARLGRTPVQAYAIGLIHGIAGSAGVGVLLLAAIPAHLLAVMTLILFALATALSMTVLSSLLGWALTRGSFGRRLFALAPALGAGSLCFGVWYALGAVGHPL